MIQAMKNLNLLQKYDVIDSQTAKVKYDQNSYIKFQTESIKSRLCDYYDAFLLVTGNIAITANNNADVALKNRAQFSTCKIEIKDVFIGEANHIYNIAMHMYNLIEYSDNYQVHQEVYGSLKEMKFLLIMLI